MSKVTFQFTSVASLKYKALGYCVYEPIEVDEQEFERIKSNGYNVEILSSSKPKKKPSKKKKG